MASSALDIRWRIVEFRDSGLVSQQRASSTIQKAV